MGKRENDITEAVHKAVECFSMASILEKKIRGIERTNKILDFTGILFPIGGAGVAAFNIGELADKLGQLNITSPPIITAVFIFTIVQTIISAYSRAFKLSENYPIYVNSKTANYKNAEKYRNIWNKYDEDENKYAKQLEEVNALNEIQQEQDYKISLTEKEKRYGLRHALREYKIICEKCRKVPEINNPSNCDVCGK